MTSPSPLHNQLDRLVALHEQAYHRAGMLDWRVGLADPATQAEIDRAEARIGRLLPAEALDLYRWHNGCTSSWFAPDLDFDSVERAAGVALVCQDFPLPDYPTNAAEHVYTEHVHTGTLFPVFNIDALQFAVVTTLGERAETSPVYYWDIEADIFTIVAESITGFVRGIADKLDEPGSTKHSEYGIYWADDPFQFDADMTPHQ